jgi:hypothetical protein
MLTCTHRLGLPEHEGNDMADHSWDVLKSTCAAALQAGAILFRKSARILCHPAALLVALTLLLPAIHASPVSARTVHGTYGGSGDAGVVDECSARRFLVGVRVRVGAWMDQIQIICQLRGTFLSTSSPTPPRGGTGGGPVTLQCPSGTWVVGAHWYITAGRQVLSLELTCANLQRGSERIIRVNGSGRSPGYHYSRANSCPIGEAGTGFTIRFGRHVNALGLVCDVRP